MTSCFISSTYVELLVEGASDARDDPNRGVVVMLISMLSPTGALFSVIVAGVNADGGAGVGFGLK